MNGENSLVDEQAVGDQVYLIYEMEAVHICIYRAVPAGLITVDQICVCLQ